MSDLKIAARCLTIDLDADDGDNTYLQPSESVACRTKQLDVRTVASEAAPIRRWGKSLSQNCQSRGEDSKLPSQMQKGLSVGLSPCASPMSNFARSHGSNMLQSNNGWRLVQGDDVLASAKLQSARYSFYSSPTNCNTNTPFEDQEFPAEPRSVNGRNDAFEESHTSSGSTPPRCRCGNASKKSEVKKEGPTKGRPYWHCEVRRCGFFAWADAANRRQGKIWWQRFPEFHVVSDFGFKAEDLRQGGIGDCWFMSALAVVAERPDLILRLFGGETARNHSGFYQINLFLDGEWRAISIDDRLPCTDQQRRPDGSGLAFSRCDGQQLWSPLLEKAYAKAHGSYKAISGGEVAEALLDLTGCPTESIDFDAPNFDTQELWRRLLYWKAQGFPMGCGTVGNPDLQEVGLCGNHAYSILDVREICDRRSLGQGPTYGGSQEDGIVRLVRIRNPHGVGEWSGEWSDHSAQWNDSLAAELGRTGIDDGTFWMDYTHFLMGFQVVDVCLAHRGWHAESFSNAFCAKTSESRLCKFMYEIRCDLPTTLYAMALQPTKRGSWCRDDRKKSYKPGDVSLLLFRLSPDGSFEGVVGGNFFCADVMARRCIQAQLEGSGARYLLVAFCFGTGPAAHGGDAKETAPFKVRFFSSQPLHVRLAETHCSPDVAATALHGLHVACLSLTPTPDRRFQRLVRPLGSDLCLFQITGEGTVLLLLVNTRSHEEVSFVLTAEVKVMIARCSEGLLAAAAAEGDDKPEQITCFNCGKVGHLARDCKNTKMRGIRPSWRYPAKWRRVKTTCRVPANSQRLALAIVGNGMQAELGGIEVQISENDQIVSNDIASRRPLKQRDLGSWLPSKGSQDAVFQKLDVFEPRTIMADLVAAAMAEAAAKALVRNGASNRVANVEQEMMEAITISSFADFEKEEERRLQQALAASVGARLPVADEETQLAEALAVSAADICQRRASGGLSDSGLEDKQIQEILEASRKEQLRAEEADLQVAMRLSRKGGMTFDVDAVEVLDSASESEAMLGTPEPKRHRAEDEAVKAS